MSARKKVIIVQSNTTKKTKLAFPEKFARAVTAMQKKIAQLESK